MRVIVDANIVFSGILTYERLLNKGFNSIITTDELYKWRQENEANT